MHTKWVTRTQWGLVQLLFNRKVRHMMDSKWSQRVDRQVHFPSPHPQLRQQIRLPVQHPEPLNQRQRRPGLGTFVARERVHPAAEQLGGFVLVGAQTYFPYAAFPNTKSTCTAS